MKNLIIIFSLIFTNSVFADFKHLLADFLENNKRIKSADLNPDLAQKQVDILWGQKQWYLSASGGKNVTESRSAQRPENDFSVGLFNNYNASIFKTFSWAGELSFNNRVNLLNTNNAKVFIQDISYKQNLGNDFFGIKFRDEVQAAEYNVQKVTAQIKDVDQSLLQQFYMSYNSARLNKTFVERDLDAKKRAEVRRDSIKKRVNAGLLERVDLDKAVMGVMYAEEEVKSSKMKLDKDMEDLSSQLSRRVKEEEIPAYEFDGSKLPSDITGSFEQNFKVEELKFELASLEKTIHKINMDFIPEIQAQGSWATSGSGLTWSESMTQNNLWDSDHVQFSGAVSLVMPLGWEVNRALKSTKQVEINQKIYDLDYMMNELINMEKGLKERVSLIRRNISSGIDRRVISVRALDETNKLYNRGRTYLDNVLISEETLTNTEKSIAGYIFNLEALIAQQAILYGKLKEELLKPEPVK
jgi:outer membrane protein TolC